MRNAVLPVIGDVGQHDDQDKAPPRDRDRPECPRDLTRAWPSPGACQDGRGCRGDPGRMAACFQDQSCTLIGTAETDQFGMVVQDAAAFNDLTLCIKGASFVGFVAQVDADDMCVFCIVHRDVGLYK